MICKISPLFKLQILGVFVNTLTDNDKYPVWDWENLQFPIQMQLSWKRKSFSTIFCSIYGISIKFWTFSEKKMTVLADVFSILPTVKDLVEKLSWRRCFRTSFDSQHVNGCQTLVISARGHFYYIFWSAWKETTNKTCPFLGVFVNALSAND